jgi:hypothetical protein
MTAIQNPRLLAIIARLQETPPPPYKKDPNMPSLTPDKVHALLRELLGRDVLSKLSRASLTAKVADYAHMTDAVDALRKTSLADTSTFYAVQNAALSRYDKLMQAFDALAGLADCGLIEDAAAESTCPEHDCDSWPLECISPLISGNVCEYNCGGCMNGEPCGTSDAVRDSYFPAHLHYVEN